MKSDKDQYSLRHRSPKHTSVQQVRREIRQSDFRYLLELYFSDYDWR